MIKRHRDDKTIHRYDKAIHRHDKTIHRYDKAYTDVKETVRP